MRKLGWFASTWMHETQHGYFVVDVAPDGTARAFRNDGMHEPLGEHEDLAAALMACAARELELAAQKGRGAA